MGDWEPGPVEIRNGILQAVHYPSFGTCASISCMGQQRANKEGDIYDAAQSIGTPDEIA